MLTESKKSSLPLHKTHHEDNGRYVFIVFISREEEEEIHYVRTASKAYEDAETFHCIPATSNDHGA